MRGQSWGLASLCHGPRKYHSFIFAHLDNAAVSSVEVIISEVSYWENHPLYLRLLSWLEQTSTWVRQQSCIGKVREGLCWLNTHSQPWRCSCAHWREATRLCERCSPKNPECPSLPTQKPIRKQVLYWMKEFENNCAPSLADHWVTQIGVKPWEKKPKNNINKTHTKE